MNELEKKGLIEEKKAQIKQLEQEILELKTPTSIAAYVHKPMLITIKSDDKNSKRAYRIWERKGFGGVEWNLMRKLCLELVKEKYDVGYGKHLSVKQLTPEDVHICAEMAEELIEVWNTHIEKVYRTEANHE